MIINNKEKKLVLHSALTPLFIRRETLSDDILFGVLTFKGQPAMKFFSAQSGAARPDDEALKIQI